jgi:SHS2 domain-containing protein
LDDSDVIPVTGVQALDHTADVGLEIDAGGLAELVQRAALGFTWLLLEREPSGQEFHRAMRVRAPDAPSLLRQTLRELLWWHERDGLSLRELGDVAVERGTEGIELTAVARLAMDESPPVREIKGVTLHGLVAEQRGARWYGHVIFDV